MALSQGKKKARRVRSTLGRAAVAGCGGMVGVKTAMPATIDHIDGCCLVSTSQIAGLAPWEARNL
jgi:hypothetical protein